MKLAIVRVRGTMKLGHDAQMTFRLLGLNKKNHCKIAEDTPQLRGMLKVVEPYATWGEVNEQVAAQLQKKGEIQRLNPPRKGYGRKGVKMPFKLGGAYGDRKEKINDLVTRMM